MVSELQSLGNAPPCGSIFSLPEVAQTEEGSEILRTVHGLNHGEDDLKSAFTMFLAW